MADLESDFSRSFSSRLKQFNFDVTRLESHGTSVGIPDMFVQGHGFDFFLELKNKKLVYRPGQKAWHYNYFLSHGREKCVLTLISENKGLRIVPGIKNWEKNKPDFTWFIDNNELSKIPLVGLFHCLTTVTNHLNYRQAIIVLARKYYPVELDYDPDAIWPAECSVDSTYDMLTFEQYKCEVFLTLNRIYRNSRNI